MRSYRETVWNPAKQMREDNQQLIWFKNKAAKHQMQAKALEESLSLVSEKHRQTLEENKIVRLKTKMHHEHIKEEVCKKMTDIIMWVLLAPLDQILKP